MYSGPVAAHAYRLLQGRRFEVAILVGPSHFVSFDGVAMVPQGGFETPLGIALVDEACAADLLRATTIVRADAAPHAREHSLEMQLPFLQRVAPGVSILPLLVGRQTAETADELGDALAAVVAGRQALLVASTDLSHYHDGHLAARLDAVVLDCVRRFDAEALQSALEARPEHACGGGPMVGVMRAARRAGAREAAVLAYADSGDVTGDKSAVVGYMAAAFGNFADA
jgi:AmmeMemoRadiSam system protein B